MIRFSCLLTELLLNSASDDEDEENLMPLSMEKEANNNNNVINNSHSLHGNGLHPSPRPTTPIIAHGGHLQAQQSAMPMSDMKSAIQRPSTPSTTIDDKDGNDSEGNQLDTLMHSICGRLHFS